MFLLNSLRAQHEIIHEAFTIPGDAGLKLSFSRFDGYSPYLDGSVRTAVLESSDSEKSGNITVTVDVKGSSLAYKDNVRVQQQDENIFLSTGGLSLLSYLSAPRLMIDITISLPRTVGNLELKTLSLPIFIQSIGRANDVVIHTESSPISVAKVDARSLTVSTNSGSITFETLSKQTIDTFTKISNSSGSTALRSSLSSPSVSAESSSGSLGLSLTTTATELKIKNSSGSIGGEVEYAGGEDGVSEYVNGSGGLKVVLRGWEGFLTAESQSGSKNVGGNGLERWNEGWKKGSGKSKAAFRSQSGSINVEVL